MQKSGKYLLFILGVSLLLAFSFAGSAAAKSVYVIANINASPTPIQAYNINPDGTLTYQDTQTVPYHGWGGVGIAVYEDPNEPPVYPSTLFVTYEQSNRIQMVDATTFANLGYTAAPGASNLAGIVFDYGKNLVYTVDRYTDNLYVYSYNPATRVFTLQPGYPKDLPNCVGVFGISLDETNGLLYIGDGYGDRIRYYDTTNWNEQGDIQVSHNPVDVAVDEVRGFVYSTGKFRNSTLFSKYDLNTNTETTINLNYLYSSEGSMGCAVDLLTGNAYVTTGYNVDRLLSFNSDLTQIDDEGNIGNPTGLCIGRRAGKQPLGIDKDDGGECVDSGEIVTYTIRFHNKNNPFDVHNVTIVDDLPSETTFDSATGGGTYDSTTHTVTWDIGTLTAGQTEQSVTLDLQVDAVPESVLINYGTIDSDETTPSTVFDETDVCPGGVQQVCDVNNDGQIDITDIRAILGARGTTASGPNDPADADGDGFITPSDAKFCIQDCGNPGCAP